MKSISYVHEICVIAPYNLVSFINNELLVNKL